ncbi:MAG: dihydrofolate reductase [Pseudoflavonifractor sp.]|nr:dihydrofolate reductase [Pseudoflavonifractor sp.]
MRLTIIAAVAEDGAIGCGGDLAYHISADLKRFKAMTTGHPVIMGRKTFESFPNGALPNRRNIVVTRNRSYSSEGAETAPSLDEAIAMAGDADEAFIIGGGEIYRQAMAMADRLLLTDIHGAVEDADTYFPEIESGVWQETERSETETDPRTGVTYEFVTYERSETR